MCKVQHRILLEASTPLPEVSDSKSGTHWKIETMSYLNCYFLQWLPRVAPIKSLKLYSIWTAIFCKWKVWATNLVKRTSCTRIAANISGVMSCCGELFFADLFACGVSTLDPPLPEQDMNVKDGLDAWLVKNINWNIPAFFNDVNLKLYIRFCLAVAYYSNSLNYFLVCTYGSVACSLLDMLNFSKTLNMNTYLQNSCLKHVDHAQFVLIP